METIRGYVDHIIYRNPGNGYTVLDVICQDDEIVCVGSIKSIDQGESLEMEGDFVEHPTYGEQFKIASYRIVVMEDAVSMERYLGSGAIRGVGPALAKRIVKKFGDDTFRIIEEEPERLIEIKGISERIAREIAMQMAEKKEMRDAMMFLQNYGIGGTLAIKIYNHYGTDLYGVLNENPYKMVEDITGVGFRTADEIARKIGIRTDSDYRVRSCILYMLLQASGEGNTYLPQDYLVKKVSEELQLDETYILPQIDNLAMDRKLIIKPDKSDPEKRIVYANAFYYEELNCARMLHNLNIKLVDESNLLPSEREKKKNDIQNIANESGVVLDELQLKAVAESINNGIFILSGGPGTGKTTTINTIIRYFEKEGLDFYLAAPTGRAAKRMTEATGYEAKTIHRLLELSGANMEEGKRAMFERNENNPLEADAVIIDEMSMVDIHLLHALLRAIMPGTHLVLVGDINQLPSVGPGQVLKDLMDSGCFSTVVLKKIFRQAETSDIVVNAHLINEGIHMEVDNKSRDFFLLERNDVNVIYKHMILLIREKLPPYVNATPNDIQVLTPMRKGPLGVETLNKILQEYLNPPENGKKEYQAGEMIYREGDKVMQIKNNYQLQWEIVSRYNIPIDSGLGVFNGDMGVIKQINEFAQNILVEFDEGKRVVYPYSQIDELEHAYAVTIHKSQGSEYPAVIIPILSGPSMLMNRNLLYTGVTRAKKCVTMLGSKEMFYSMIDNERQNKRYTGLAEQIKEMAFEE